MIILAVIGILVGAVLGLRFKVLVLIPAMCVELAIVLTGGIAGGNRLWWIALAMIVIATSTQVGFFTGSVVRSVMAARIAADGKGSIPTSAGLSGSV